MADYSDFIGKKAYKNSGGMYDSIVGVIERDDSGITPLMIRHTDGSGIGAFPQDLVIIEEDDIMTDKLTVGFKRLNDNATIPTKAHASDSGFDLYASEDVIIEPGETAVVPTGIAVVLPEGTEAQIRPRSGVTSKTKLRVQLGTIDNQYRGEVGVIVDNISMDTWSNMSRLLDNSYAKETLNKYRGYKIRKGDRIAQLVVQHLPQVEAVEVEELTEDSERGSRGFGSSGVRD